MTHIKKVRIFIISIGLFSIIFACKRSSNHSSGLDFPLTYSGKLPCADCSALLVKITFNADHTYSETDIYKDTPKGDKPFNYHGKWIWKFSNITGKQQDTLFVLNPDDSLRINYYLMSGKNKIRMLSRQKQVIHSPFNNTLILKK